MVRTIDRARLFDALPDACLVLTPDLVIVDANHAYCTLLRRGVDELVGRTVGQVLTVNPQDPAAAHRLTSAYRRVLRSKVSTDLGVVRYDLPVSELTAAAAVEYTPRYWTVRVVPVLDGAGEVELLLKRVREVTDVPAELVSSLAGPSDPAGGQLDVAAAALTAAELATALSAELVQMREAMASRAVIEQAKGVLMSQRQCSEDVAFALLSELSQQTNVKLRDVCAELVGGGRAAALDASSCG